MKNKISYRILWLLVLPILIGQFSCTDKLDVLPKQSIDAGTALTTPENIKATLVGTYLQARDADLFGSVFNEYSELLAATTDFRFVGTYEQPGEFINKAITVTNSYVEDSWVEAYELINLCNTLLDPEVLAILDPADADMVEGEAKFLRGWIYFDMARFFGAPYEAGQTNDQLGVPLVTTPTSDVADAIKVARATVQQNYDQAISDLTDAKGLLPETNGVYASSDAASALLARIYLQMGDFANAAAEANTVIESGNYTLTATPREEFNNNGNSSEDIFAFQNNTASNTSWLAVMYASLGSGGRGDYEIAQSFLDSFDPGDLRAEFQGELEMESSYTIFDVSKMYYYGVGNINNFGGINTSKWGDYYTNLPMFRLAEMYLVRAEANFEGTHAQVGPNTPLEDINVIRDRALAPALPGPITQADIRQERYWELCWEGHRLHDLKRWGLNVGTLTYDAWQLVLPIPRSEIEVNELLVQNDGYSTN